MLARILLVNLLGFAGVAAAYFQEYLSFLFEADTSGISYGIAGVFVIGLFFALVRAWQFGRELDAIKAYRAGVDDGSWRVHDYLDYTAHANVHAPLVADSLKIKLTNRVRIVKFVAESLVVLGLIGTVIGFIVALQGVDPSVGGNVDAIAPMIATLLEGMAIALHTTLIGSVLALWLGLNVVILQTAVANLYAEIVLAGEVPS